MKKVYTVSIPASTFWKIVVPACILLALGGAATGMLVVDRVVMPRIVSVNRGLVTVPEITNQPWEKARQKLFHAGLRIQVTQRVYHASVEDNHVISQNPPPGQKLNVEERRGVEVVMSRGPEVATIPDLRNMTESQAVRELRKKGFLVGKVIQRYSDDIRKDLVISLSPRPGTAISRELPVDITVSRGPEPTHAEVPNLIGELLSSAKNMIQESGLTVGKIETRRSAAAPGSVISQSAPPGSALPLKAAVNLVVAAGE